MARYSRLEVAQVMQETGMVPLFYHPDVELGKKVLKACYDGGARLLEFTARGDFAYEVFSELNKYALAKLPGMIMGVGSITDAAAASLFIQMGANFIVTPSLREDIAVTCNRRKIMYSPGCGSLTEINRAEELGVEIIKLFPGSTYGPDFVKAIKGPQPWTSIMPTGGVSTETDNLKAWFASGVTCVGMGSQLISKKVLADQDYAGLEALVRDTLKTIQEIR
ncbi:bifunctional 4-hydroxy-2-oxoglutarate aldolase/2-dehydro-3-deoxy-phosphogluconate aldolase [Flagellimonas alvinocaridis]|uniref:Bifunctional 4-hydroxy-2-oxoglutarate aldolase/2-dehydro-3-deoxy-phosphogluconate aldolase n=1 Tax=Flagellimonas alvinocaridis TaxID=2530200 RepID=A0A4S8RKG6_9FLAO|nr:bifunctional 4-hydroxy-2-oxoglutarate aldolase/2-dehydro-3-deoxy-phosphogluconate aldolase [Allomuricauda alvinocaridis]THV58172.1 bifunctional 4-hydroxy-2-oxoglutarate aldolase/2-dehydro-3-deoxy-phosphogluconate aldolase [Allomuricauda alvinocaridis]